jgi:ABC-type glycerol-3-phosphate transport system substrate-binding protein
MPAQIEPFAGVVRYWAKADARYGDPYQWAASVRWIDHETLEILGITQPPTPAVWRAVKAAAKQNGVKQIVFVRRRDGKSRTKRMSL